MSSASPTKGVLAESGGAANSATPLDYDTYARLSDGKRECASFGSLIASHHRKTALETLQMPVKTGK